MHHEIAVIGAGSGSSIIDSRFDHLDVAVVERDRFGGTCLNSGCIPTKMYVYAADVAETVRRAARYGVDAELVGIRWQDIRDRIFGRIDPISDGIREYRSDPIRTPNVTAYLGDARFVGPKRIRVTLPDGSQDDVTADRLIVSAGARPAVPEVILRSGVPFETSETIMRREELPAELVILGGGYIGAEFAHVMSAFGCEVTIVTHGDSLLSRQDDDIAAAFTKIAQQRWQVRLGQEVVAADEHSGQIRLHLDDGSVVSGDALLVASGRIPNGDQLDVAAAGIETHADGRIAVDAHQRTTAAGVFALGDISSPFQLKHVANHEKRVVAHNLLNPDRLIATSHAAVPSAVFTDPQIAAVGLTERECSAAGFDYVTSTQQYGDVAFGWALEDTTGFCKVIADPRTGLLLGAHVMGPQASTVIQPLIQAISLGLDARTVATGQYWIHPALSELVENALLGLRLAV